MAENFQGQVTINSAVGQGRIILSPDAALENISQFVSAAGHRFTQGTTIGAAFVNIGGHGGLLDFDGSLLPESVSVDPAKLTVGGRGIAGTIEVEARNGKAFLRVDGNSGVVEVLASDGKAILRLGREGIFLLDVQGRESIRLGARDGIIILNNAEGRESIRLDEGGIRLTGDVVMAGAEGQESMRLGREGIFLLDVQGRESIRLGARDGIIILNNAEGRESIRLDEGGIRLTGDVVMAGGDIKLTGADCAEAFKASDPLALEPGTVSVIGPDGALQPCCKAYDTRVAGVVAGAGNLRPGIILGQGVANGGSVPLSLTGRTWCKVDAGFGSIQPGDLLTTSISPGHAMRADDPYERIGAIIGKALAELDSGRDLVPILVGLQ